MPVDSSDHETWEKRLHELLAPWETLRYASAREWKRKGGKVIGILCTNVPEEIIYAAGILPWRVTGTWAADISKALSIRSASSCDRCNHILQSMLEGELDFLDGVVATTSDQDVIRLWDVWYHLKRLPFMYILHVPHTQSATACSYFAHRLTDFIHAIEKFTGVTLGEFQLQQAIEVYNASRALMSQVYELRKREHPPLSGAEMLHLALVGTVIAKADFNRELESLLPYLRKRRCSLRKLKPRLLVSSDLMDNPQYLEIVENVGCLVAMDDLDVGSRYYLGSVGLNSVDPAGALARYYLYRPASPWLTTWDKQVQQVTQWAREFDVDLVLELVQRCSRAREMRRSYFLEALERAGIKAMSFERQYCLANEAQLQTRIQAFLETVQSYLEEGT